MVFFQIVNNGKWKLHRKVEEKSFSHFEGVSNLPKSAENQVCRSGLYRSQKKSFPSFESLSLENDFYFVFCSFLLSKKLKQQFIKKKVSRTREKPEVYHKKTKLLWSTLW